MGLDALVVGLNPALAQEPPRHTAFENLLFHLSHAYREAEPVVNPKDRIKELREARKRGEYAGRSAVLVEEIGEQLDRIQASNDFRYRGMLHAYADLGEAALEAGAEAIARHDTFEAMHYLTEAYEVFGSVSRRYESELAFGFTDRLENRAYVERNLSLAGLFREAVRQGSELPDGAGPMNVAMAYLRAGGEVPMPIRAAIVRGRNLAESAPNGRRSLVYRDLDRLADAARIAYS